MVCDNLDWWNLCSDDSNNVLSWFKHHHKNTTTQTQFGSSKSPTQQHHHKHQHKTTNTKTLQYHSILQSTTSVLLQYYKVLLRTTKYYSSTTKYYSSTTKSTPVLLRTTKYYSSTTPYYKVQLQYANTTKYNTTTGFFHSNRTSLRPCSCQVAVRNDIRHGVRNYTRLCSWHFVRSSPYPMQPATAYMMPQATSQRVLFLRHCSPQQHTHQANAARHGRIGRALEMTF